jgi:large subunit ribosomal protein L13
VPKKAFVLNFTEFQQSVSFCDYNSVKFNQFKDCAMAQFTKSVKSSDVKRDWVVVDAEGKVFGRLMTEIATMLRGKNKPFYTPNVDCGDYVIVINASKAKFSKLSKLEDKEYHRHTGYFGGVKTEKLGDLLEGNPEKLFKLSARGMLPKTKLGKEMLKKLKVYAGSEHPHTAQVKA